MEEIQPCEECKTNRWQTIVKNIAWKCRNCGIVRSVDPKIAALFNVKRQQIIIDPPLPPTSTPWTENTKVSEDVAIKIS
jgi:PHP family Zn ribbon phosphoesterase